MESICDDPKVDVVSRRYAEDLCQLFDRKNLRGFRGFTMLIDADQNAQFLSRQQVIRFRDMVVKLAEWIVTHQNEFVNTES